MTRRWASDASASSPLRPPGDGECQYCGSTPAEHVAYQSMVSAVILYWVGTMQGWMCGMCGLAVFRQQTSRTLIGCWWGVGVVGAPIILVANRMRLRRTLRLDPPRPTPGVAGQVAAPLDPGRSVLRRPRTLLCIAAAVVGIPVIGLLVLIVIGTVGG